VELYWDRPPEAWPRTPTGELAMFTWRLDLNGLLQEIEPEAIAPKVEEGPRDL
jgi:catechol 2,3-dioxygenase